MDKVGIKGSLARERKRNHTPNFLETDTHFFVRVKSIAEIEQPIYMYDLCVSDSHTFVGNGLVCHNTITEAMAAKKPVIAPMHTSIEEICQAGDRAYMLTTLYPVVAMVDNIIRFQTDIYEIAETIAEVEADLKSNSPKLKNKIINAFAFVNSLSWDKIAKRFADEMKKLV
jgi:glycosyltransferase involved in cell wall biosynthesis